jgi:lipoprotein-anchoring transpeptidase ErfK/SrfK
MASGRVRFVGWLCVGILLLASLLVVPTAAGAATAPLYARPTGHTIPAAFRPLWESTGGQNGLGWPLDEAQRVNGGTEQWFEYGRIVQKAGGQPELAVVGIEAAKFGSVLDTKPFKPIPKPQGPIPANANYLPKWGHWVANGFFSVWNTKQALLGEPISEEFTQDGMTVQYFERGQLELDATANNAIRTTQLGVLAHGPAAPAVDPPDGADFIGDAPIKSIFGVKAHDGHWVLVNLATQHLYAYDGTKLVDDLDVSTGVPGHDTPTGTFFVQQRFLSQEMVGPGYDLPNVPYVQYFGNDSLSWQEGYSLHGTYWHHNWGHVMSHGCVNLPTDFAAWLWDWATVGTPVEIIAGA